MATYGCRMIDHRANTIEIRPAHPADELALTRLGQLDSARVPPTPLLLAIEGGELRAAISLDTGAAIADPFVPTERLVGLLRTHAAPQQRRRPSRSWLPLLRHAPA
jgi:hypothetical protein